MTPVVPPFQRGGGFGTLGSSFKQPVLPEPVSWAPSAPGAWITLGLLALGLLGAGWLALQRYRRRAPRRAALRVLGRLEAKPSSLPELARLLKAVALASFPRPRVAPLSGEPWRAFLIATSPGSGFEGTAGEALVTLGERGAEAVSATAVAPLFAAARSWITRHRAAAPAGPA